MPYLLDGNNLIGIVRRTSRPSEEDRSALIADVDLYVGDIFRALSRR